MGGTKMKIQRFVMGSAALLLVGGVALMAGVALGSGSARQDGDPPKAAPGEQVTPSTARAAKATLPKSQAYVHFRTDGTIIEPSKKVDAVHRLSTGTYCVELHKSIHVSLETYAHGSIDYLITPTYMVTVQQNSSSTCLGRGYD